jgi:SPX domain protein involved in polyphosphate accumulation
MSPNLRYEKKFIAEGFNLAEVLAKVHRHPSAFREVYPPRMINNIYVDSPTRRDYHDHINGAANRTKTRVRWYGQRFEVAERPALERKSKRGAASAKETYALAPLSIAGGSVRSLLNRAFETGVLPEILKSALRHLEPSLFSRYERHYFLSRDARFRLTVDCNLQFASASHNGRPISFPRPAASPVILELKFGREFAGDAHGVTNALPFRVARFSKYITGIQSV